MKYILSLFLASMATFLFGQPLINSKVQMEGFSVYQDAKEAGQFYYGPGKISLAIAEGGKPDFQLTQMRYTGTACAGDQGEARFFNLVQFSLEMEKADPKALAGLEASLKRKHRNPRAKLSPLPIRFLQTHVLLPSASSGRSQRAEAAGVSEGNGQTGGTYWDKKSFTFRLSNEESQMLWRQVEENHMVLSVGYGFYADAVLGEDGEMTLSGSKADVEEMLNGADWEELLRGDTAAITRLIHAGTLTLDLDVSKYPSLLKKLDINEGLPPDYPALELRCYDFRDGLRPDLALKRIEVAAIGINGKPLSPKSIQFTKRNPQKYLQNFRFPFAVKMEEEMQYRITSYTLKGEKKATEWISRPICEGLVDLTTPAGENPLEKVELAFELDPVEMDSSGFTSVQVILGFEQGGSLHLQNLELHKEGGDSYKEFAYVRDKGSKGVMGLIWRKENGEEVKEEAVLLEEDYHFLQPPK